MIKNGKVDNVSNELKVLNLDNNLNMQEFINTIDKAVAEYSSDDPEVLLKNSPKINEAFDKVDGARKDLKKLVDKYTLDKIEPLKELVNKVKDIRKQRTDKQRHKQKIAAMTYYKDEHGDDVPQMKHVWGLIFNESWLNVGNKDKYKELIDEAVARVHTDIKLIKRSNLDVDNYLKDLDVDRVLAESEQEIDVIENTEVKAPYKEPGSGNEILSKSLKLNIVVTKETQGKLVEFLNENKYAWSVIK